MAPHDSERDDRTLPDPRPRLASTDGEALDELSFTTRYERQAALGEGGMGEVRLCKDRRIGREVAMKTMLPEYVDTDLRTRFLREARVQGQLEHPAIVPVYDLGRDPAGQAFFTMKRVRGRTFEQIVAGLRAGDAAVAHEYTRRKLLSAFATVCLAVHFAHTRGVLHRDLKPGNIMLGDFGEVYVLDWGLAKVVGLLDEAPSHGGVTLDSPDSGRTVHGETLGTLGYMPPEQARGELDALDARTDVYALGAILFELLTLEPLHAGQTSAALFAATLKGADARASVRTPHRHVPPELEAVCVRATRSAPADRYATPRELNDEIEAFLDRDLDLERRRAKAAEHAENAAQLAKRIVRAHGRTGVRDHDARSEAMREVNAALALDPDNRDARASLWLLLTVLPQEMPPEAEAELVAMMVRDQRLGTRSALVAMTGLVVVVPLLLWMGVRSWPLFWAFIGSCALLGMGAAHVARRPRSDGRLPFFLVLLAMAMSLSVAAALGPILVFPTLVTALAAVFSVGRRGKGQTALLIATMLPTLLVPFALEWTGAVRATMTFDGEGVTILPRALELVPLPSKALLTVAYSLLVVMVIFIIGRFRQTLWEAERQLTVQRWQLEQLFPPELRVRARQLTGG